MRVSIVLVQAEATQSDGLGFIALQELPVHATLWLELDSTTLVELLAELSARGCEVAVHSEYAEPSPTLLPHAVDYAAVRTRLTLHGLTPRECDVVVLDLQGRSRADIAAICGISPASIKKYWQAIYGKTGKQTRSAFRQWALDSVDER